MRWRGGVGLIHPDSQPFFGDGILNIFDGHGGAGDAQHAGTFTGGRANPSGEFREVVGLVEPVQGFFPAPPVHQVVPLGDQVVDGATAGHAADGHAGVAEGGAAVHTTGSLGLQPRVGHGQVELIPVADAVRRGDFFRHLPQIFHKAGWFSHGGCPEVEGLDEGQKSVVL